jgi:EF-P beta-lysylation protein EpmB
MTAAWQRELADSITRPEALIAAVGLGAEHIEPARAAAAGFDLRVTRAYLSRIRHGDPDDPLLLQVLPRAAELADAAGYESDPLRERSARRAPNLLQKYHGRALLIATEACAIHCRYCFRREFPYAESRDGDGRLRAALEAIAADDSLHEIILSGGDPLSLSDARLASITDALVAMPHVRRIRVHTRQPVVLPSRVDDGLVGWIRGIRLPLTFVLHVNHANEIDAGVRAACARLRAAGVTLLNQSVLLRGVNDEVEILETLSSALFDAGVLPYYLHLPDRVRGTAHFDVEEKRARGLLAQLSARLSGYLVPRLVREVPGAPAKMSVAF